MTADGNGRSQHLSQFSSRNYRLYTLFMAFCIYVGITIFVVQLPVRRGVSAPTTDGTDIDLYSIHGTETKNGSGNVTVNLQLLSSDSESLVSLLAILSKTILVRRAYFDDRKRDGHENAVVFTMEVKRSIKSNVFTGCRVGGRESSKVHFRYSGPYEWAIAHMHVTKNIALVDCYDVHWAKDGDPAYLIVDNFKIGSTVIKRGEVKSQRNLVVPVRNNISDSPSVVACLATVRFAEISPSADGMLHNWLRYQKTIGVDHVHMIADDTFVIAGGMDNSYIQDAVKENYLSVDFWPRWFNKTEIFQSSQHLAYNDCAYRFMGAYDYILFADSDDFFVPVKSKSIKTYLKKWCIGQIASCKFEWYTFYPDCGWNPKSVGADGNLTATVYYSKTTKRGEPKSAHKIQALVDVGRHGARVLMPGCKRKWIPSNEAYYAHLRKQQTPPRGC